MGDVTPCSVSKFFDETQRKYFALINGEEETGSQSVQSKITEIIQKLEDLTRQVSVLGILSDNEHFEEMNPSELKFILLPFMMGNLWQLSTTENRDTVCHWSKVYFRDFLKRCRNYEIISKLPLEAMAVSDDEKQDENLSPKRPTPKMNSDDIRALKVQKFKEAKVLDELINPFLNLHLKGELLDDEDIRTFVVSLLKRHALDAEDQLRSIAQELELIKYAERMTLGTTETNNPSSSSTSNSHYHPLHCRHSATSKDNDSRQKKPHIFILTKSQIEKQVFGAGYPAIPVMTVDELYEQRRKNGQWGHTSSSANLPPAGETDDDRDAQREEQEEQDDEELLARQRQMDDYKDDHRRGWGNRYNRS